MDEMGHNTSSIRIVALYHSQNARSSRRQCRSTFNSKNKTIPLPLPHCEYVNCEYQII